MQRGGGTPVFGHTQTATKHGPEQLDPVGPVLSRGWSRDMQRLLPASVILSFFG